MQHSVLLARGEIPFHAEPIHPRYSKATYRWDAETRDFLLTQGFAPNNMGIPLEQAATQAEALLLTRDNPLAAIPILSAILDEPKQEYEAFSRARLCYLLGLAYERIDDDKSAINIYYQLWRNYPDTPYALLARAKLEPTP